MRLERASAKAVRYAIMKWHYSRSIPLVQCAYSVFNDEGEFCGCIAYSIGAASHIASPFGLRNGQVIELVRVALNGNHGQTSKAVALSLKLVQRDSPLAQIVISYADERQNHVGIIYQASNWFHLSTNKTVRKFIHNGIVLHDRNVSESGYKKQFGRIVKTFKPSEIDTVLPSSIKHKYAYPLTKDARILLQSMSKPYPKRALSVASDTVSNHDAKDGATPINAL